MSVTLSDTVCLHPEVEEKLKKWLKTRPTPAFLCVGPPGIGKTTLVHRVCQLEGYWARELNASHTRTGSAFRDLILPLLDNPGITSWVSTKAYNGHIVILDEMDGLSQGERGGLQELLKYLRDNKKGNIKVPLILICNEINGRKMQQILRLCEVVSVGKPTNDILRGWLGRDLKYNENLLDLRQLLRGDTPPEQIDDSLVTVNDFITDEIIDETPETYSAAWFTLYKEWDPYSELDLETKDANLAGLLFHQNLPARLKGIQGGGRWEDYKNIHNLFTESDLADYWAFFHQCWILLGISNYMKLKYPNQLLQDLPYVKKKLPEVNSLDYTWVLTKQSALFNTWKEMLRLTENVGCSLRLISDYCDVAPQTKYSAAISLSHISK
jgi:GTPase SAR1 family protein